MENNEFLPEGYIVPDKSNGYMKFKPGENRFRIVSKPIVGWEWWIEEDGNRRPMRTRDFGKIPAQFAGEAKHFWAMVVWNYDAKQLQVLEITQKGIQKFIEGLTRKPSWGAPYDYDLVVDRSGEGLETEYAVSPEPKAEVPLQARAALKAVSINLEALFDGQDPFTSNEKVEDLTEDVDPDEIPLEPEGEEK